jgi:hypothetical protein
MMEQASVVPPQAVWRALQTDWHIWKETLAAGLQAGKFHWQVNCL